MNMKLELEWMVSPLPGVEKLLTRTAQECLRAEGIEYPAYAQLQITDDEGIHEINRDYRGVDRPTDVLSFPMFEDEGLDEDEALGELILGDIVLSLERAKEQAEEYGHSFERECAFLCVHSVLHLLGYDHEISEEEEIEMFARQEAILQELGITR